MTLTKAEADRLVSDGLLKVAGAAKFLNVGRTQIYNLMASGQLAYVRVGRSRRVPKRSLIEFAAKQLVRPCDH